jgi:hypothetical protein
MRMSSRVKSSTGSAAILPATCWQPQPLDFKRRGK